MFLYHFFYHYFQSKTKTNICFHRKATFLLIRVSINYCFEPKLSYPLCLAKICIVLALQWTLNQSVSDILTFHQNSSFSWVIRDLSNLALYMDQNTLFSRAVEIKFFHPNSHLRRLRRPLLKCR